MILILKLNCFYIIKAIYASVENTDDRKTFQKMLNLTF